MFPCPDKKSSQNPHPKLVDKTIEYILKCSENTGENTYGLVTFRVRPGQLWYFFSLLFFLPLFFPSWPNFCSLLGAARSKRSFAQLFAAIPTVSRKKRRQQRRKKTTCQLFLSPLFFGLSSLPLAFYARKILIFGEWFYCFVGKILLFPFKTYVKFKHGVYLARI